MFKKGNKGITLIALVITIIVLLILAGITIAQITGQDSAPEKAAQAKVENERGAAKDAATMLVTEKIQGYYEDKYEKTPATTTAANQLEYIAEKLGSGVTTGDYTVTVTAAGVITVTKGTETLATGTVSNDGVITWDGTVTGGNTDNTSGGPTVVGGINSIQRWDLVNYNPGTLSIASVDLPEGAEIEKTKLASLTLPEGVLLRSNNLVANQATDWRVLSVTDDGDVLIVPTNGFVAKLKFRGINGYNNSIQALNKVASIYKNSSYAKEARSLTANDIDKLAGFDPTKVTATSTTAGGEMSLTINSRFGMNDNLDIIDYEEEGERVFTMKPGTKEYGYEANLYDMSWTSCRLFYDCFGDRGDGYPESMPVWLATRSVFVSQANNDTRFCLQYLDWTGMSSYTICSLSNHTEDGEPDNAGNVVPVIYLKSNVTMEKDENGVWQLSVK